MLAGILRLAEFAGSVQAHAKGGKHGKDKHFTRGVRWARAQFRDPNPVVEHLMAQQGILIPVKVTTVVPSPFLSADLKEIAIGDDSHDYAIKPPLPHYPEHAATEALCYKLATACGLALPQPARLIMSNGDEAFGSRFEGGVSDYNAIAIQDRIAVLVECGPWLSALCALDVFLANPDRHPGNGLFRKSTVTNRWTFIAMDFSRALWFGGFPNTTCANLMLSGNNTAAMINALKQINAWDSSRAKSVATSLLSVDYGDIVSWVNGMPAKWVTPNVAALPNWWQSNARNDRINELLTLL